MDPIVPGRSRRRTDESLRYRVAVDGSPPGRKTLSVVDRLTAGTLCEWHDAIVDYMLDAGVVPRDWSGGGERFCDKHFVQHLALAGAAASLAIEQVRGGVDGIVATTVAARDDRPKPPAAATTASGVAPRPLLAARLERLGLALAGTHRRVAEQLFARPGCHLSIDDLLGVMRLEGLDADEARVAACLDDLARHRIISRIEVDADNVFYDIRTFPHAHIFNPATRELTDATVTGVVTMASDSATAKIRVVGDGRIEVASGAGDRS